MLGRAVNNYQPPPSQRDAAAASKVAAAKPSSSPLGQKGVDDMLKDAPSKNKGSIAGWAYQDPRTTSTAHPKSYTRTTSSSGYQSLPGTYPSPRPSNDLKRPYGAVNGVGATTTRQESVQKVQSWNAPKPGASIYGNGGFASGQNSINAIDLDNDIVDLTQDEAPRKSHVPTTWVDLQMNEDEYENDSEIDLDMEYALPLPQAAPTLAQPLQDVSINKSATPTTMMPPRTPAVTSRGLPIPSSAPTWPSSPAEHHQPPKPKTLDTIKEFSNAPPVSSEPSEDANPRPAKRRTAPWGSNFPPCPSCQSTEHALKDCPNLPKNKRASGSSQNPPSRFTPLPAEKGKTMPWETSAPDLKKAFKEGQKKKGDSKTRQAMAEMFGAAQAEKSTRREASSRVKPVQIFLSNEQLKVLNLVAREKKSVFFTGSAGTGKSVLMRAIIADLQKTYIRTPECIAVTASTGLAACNIGGVTLHSFSGIGLGKESVPDLVKKIMRNQKAKNRWLKCKVLVIDEISMVDGDLFDKLEGIARAIRKNARPFGGIQLVVTGDFFQLPPVPDYGNRNVKFAFDADTWQTSIHHTIGLTEVFRQRDPAFANMLNEMRLGRLSDQTLKAFRALDRPLSGDSKIVPTELFPTRKEVEDANFRKLRELKGTGKVFIAEDGGTVKDKQQLDRLLQNFMAPKVLELKKGCQVMLIKNMDELLVNGSLGTVTRFATEQQFSLYLEGGLDELYDSDDPSTDGVLTAAAKAQIKSMAAGGAKLVATTEKRFPVVNFQLPDGRERELLLQPEDWKVELPNGEVQAQRRQLPLILAWALSIHKAQGQTLERVKVDLRRVFENGQAYVALSRATTQEGLWVQNFNAKAVMAHPRVGEFYTSLYSVNKALKHPKVCAKPKATGECPPELEMDGLQGQGGGGRGDDGFDDDEEAMMAYGEI